jgi:hypothetical protein
MGRGEVYEDNGGGLHLYAGSDTVWFLGVAGGAVGPDPGAFAAEARALSVGEWEPCEEDGQVPHPARVLDSGDLELIGTWYPDGTVEVPTRGGGPVAGASGTVYLGLLGADGELIPGWEERAPYRAVDADRSLGSRAAARLVAEVELDPGEARRMVSAYLAEHPEAEGWSDARLAEAAFEASEWWGRP